MKKLVFLTDLDNTLLDNDKLKLQIKQSLVKVLGRKEATHFWDHHDQFRDEKKLVDFPNIIKEYCSEFHKESCDLKLTNIFTIIDFKACLYPKSVETLKYLRTKGKVYIFTEGDSVYQKRKAEESGLLSLVDGMFLYENKLKHLPELIKRFSGSAIVLIDDKPDTLKNVTKKYPKIKTVEVCQGHYSKEDHTTHKMFTLTIDSLSEIKGNLEKIS